MSLRANRVGHALSPQVLWATLRGSILVYRRASGALVVDSVPLVSVFRPHSAHRRGPLGLVLPTFPQNGAVCEEIPGVARGAEQVGAAALWACDHLFWRGPVLECFTALTLAAAATSEVAIGTGVLQLPMRSPAVVAKTAASLQQVSGGRFVLGVGVGVHAGEYEAAGARFGGRGRALDAGIDRVRDLWARNGGDYPMLPQPSPVPVWVGGSSAAARRRAALRGDGWMPMFFGPADLRVQYDLLAEELAAAGRPADSVRRALLVFVACDESYSGAAREKGLDWLSSLYGLPPRAFERHLLAGSAVECAEQVAAFRDAGAEHVCIFVADDRPLEQFAAICDIVR